MRKNLTLSSFYTVFSYNIFMIIKFAKTLLFTTITQKKTSLMNLERTFLAIESNPEIPYKYQLKIQVNLVFFNFPSCSESNPQNSLKIKSPVYLSIQFWKLKSQKAIKVNLISLIFNVFHLRQKLLKNVKTLKMITKRFFTNCNKKIKHDQTW